MLRQRGHLVGLCAGSDGLIGRLLHSCLGCLGSLAGASTTAASASATATSAAAAAAFLGRLILGRLCRDLSFGGGRSRDLSFGGGGGGGGPAREFLARHRHEGPAGRLGGLPGRRGLRDRLGRRGLLGFLGLLGLSLGGAATTRRALRLDGLVVGITAAAAAWCDTRFLVWHLGHGEVAVRGDTAAAAGALLDLGHGGDVDEHVSNVHEVAAGVAAEADDLHARAHLLHGGDRRCEVTIAGNDDGDVQLVAHPHQVHDELDVKVGLDAAIAVLADVLAHDLVAAAGKEGMELALVLVLRVEAGVGVGAYEVATRRGGVEEGDIVDVDAGGLGRIKDIRYVYEDGDVLAHAGLLCGASC